MAKVPITITLYKSELTYDVMNKTFLTGRSRDIGTNHEEVAHMIANEDEENINQVLRSIGNAYGTLLTKLSEYLDQNDTSDSTTSASNVLEDETENIEVILYMPANVNTTTRTTIAQAMHQYIVNTAIADWFTIADKNDAADYVTLAGANLELIREAINQRVRPRRTDPTISNSGTDSGTDSGTGTP